MEEYTFENDLQRTAFVHYGHLPTERENLQFILRKITEDNLQNFAETYLNSSLNFISSAFDLLILEISLSAI